MGAVCQPQKAIWSKLPIVMRPNGGVSMHRDPTQAILTTLINILAQRGILTPADIQKLQSASFFG